MRKIIDCVYLIGILVLIAFTLLKAKLPGIMLEYQYLILGLTAIVVAIAFWYHQKLKKKR